MGIRFITKVSMPAEVVSLKKLLHQKIAGYQPARPLTKVHASAATKPDLEFCPRQYALHNSIPTAKLKPEFISTALQVTFNHGHDLQKRLTEDYMSEIAVGDWKCLSCSATKKFCKKPQGRCKTVGVTCNWIYEEVRVESEYSGISGAIDVMVNLGNPKVTLVEVKTISKEEFAKLKAPLSEHRYRTNLYLRLIDESSYKFKGMIDTTTAIVLYIIKGFGCKDTDISDWGLHDAAMSPFKEYTVTRDDSDTQKVSDSARKYKLFQEGIEAMPQGVCPTATCKRASACTVSKECFSGKYPAKQYMKED